MRNTGASIRARLLNIAKHNNQDYNALLVHYAQERFLYRLSRSKYRSNLILKGALLFLPHGLPLTRTTKDIDFLGSGVSANIAKLKIVLQEIADMREDDGMEFLSKSISLKQIVEKADYPGIRARIGCTLGGAKFPLQLDIGFGDTIVAGPVEIDYPVILDQPTPKILAYSLESAIAEKFEAIVKLNVISSRMKDFHDILSIASQRKFELQTLREACLTTFQQRGTSVEDRKTVFSESFRTDGKMQQMWNAFHERSLLTQKQSFSEANEMLEKFLEPIFGNLEDTKEWSPDQWKWIDQKKPSADKNKKRK